jgi:ankyrin repeat protein
LQYCDGSILLFPISFGQYDVVKILLEKGASATSWAKAEIGYNYNFTPIEQATASGHDKIIELLVSYGATKINEKDAAQLRFIDLAGFGTISDLKEQIKKGADVNTCNSNDETALLRALDQIFYSYDSYLKILYLLDLGADVNLKCGGGGPPLHLLIDKSSFLAQHKQDPKCVKKAQESIKNGENILQELIKRGAHISGKDEDGKTPLHIAAEYNHLYAARLLLRSGSKVMPKDNSGKTPLDYAESAEMIKLLKEHGAKEQ